jgi:hypothetical protein
MRVDMTLASGWPYGGPHVGGHQSAGRLRVAAELAAGATSVALPAVMSGEKLLAAFAARGNAKQYDATALKLVEAAARPGAGPRRDRAGFHPARA